MARNSPERAVAVQILDAWGSHPQIRLWRSNSGTGWFANGKPARKGDPGAYPVKFGIAGQGDYTGLVLFEDARGVARGVRLEVETKSETGRPSDEQRNFQAMIERFAGVYVLARSLADFDAAMARMGITR